MSAGLLGQTCTCVVSCTMSSGCSGSSTSALATFGRPSAASSPTQVKRVLELCCAATSSSKWAREGTRKRTPAQFHRRLGEFTAFGPAVWLTEHIRLPEQFEELRWLTQAPPHTPPELLGWKPRHEGKTKESSMQVKLEVVLAFPLAPSASTYRSTGRCSMFKSGLLRASCVGEPLAPTRN